MALVDFDLASVVIRGNAMGGIAGGSVMSVGVQQLMRDVVAGDAELETVTIASETIPGAVVVGGAATDHDRLTRFLKIPAVVRVLMCIAAGKFVSGARALLRRETFGISAAGV